MYTNRVEAQREIRKKLQIRILKLLILIAVIFLLILIGLFIWKTLNSIALQNQEEMLTNSGEGVRLDAPRETVQPDKSDSKDNLGIISVKQNSGAAKAAVGDAEITLDFVGDIMLGGKVGTLLDKNGFDYPYTHIRSYIEKADIAVANLETAVTERGEPQEKQYTFRTSPKAIPALAEAGFDLMNLANNHSLDYGVVGLLDTLQFLDQAGVKRIGAGKDANEANSPVYIEKKGMKIAFLGFSRVVPDVSWKAGKNQPGVAETYNYTRPVKEIKSARQKADLVVVVVHWGVERQGTADKFQVELAHRYIDAGADLVVGSHAHVLQGLEFYKGKWIVYGLGNFIFTSNNIADTSKTAILEAHCSIKLSCKLQLIPFLIKWAKPEPMDEKGRKLLFENLSDLSVYAEVDKDGKVVSSE